MNLHAGKEGKLSVVIITLEFAAERELELSCVCDTIC